LQSNQIFNNFQIYGALPATAAHVEVRVQFVSILEVMEKIPVHVT